MKQNRITGSITVLFIFATILFTAGVPFTSSMVIQQRYIPETKYTYWNEIDPDLQDDIYLNPGFKSYFHKKAAPPVNDIYPTVTVRQLMWALRMKPLPKQIWETVFDSRILLPLL